MLRYLDTPVNAAPLLTFRLVFGLMMAFGTARFVGLGWVGHHYLDPVLHFKFWGFGWVDALPGPWLYAVHGVMFLAALGIAFAWGTAYRIAAAAFFLTFTYTELIDSTYYLNHYYFVSLVAGLLIFVPAPRWLAIRPDAGCPTIRRWPIVLLKFQIFIVYFHAGLAKINTDWLLHALPLKIWLPAHATLPVIGPLLQLPATAYVFSWAGMLFDTFIVFFMLWGRTRPLAYVAIVVFHTLTGLLFQIGIFPLVMMAGTLIFFSDRWHTRLLAFCQALWRRIAFGTGSWKIFSRPIVEYNSAPHGRLSRVGFSALLLYMTFQLLFPWRYLLYPGPLFWTEDGYRFSWRVMLMEKAGTATFYVRDGRTGREGEVLNREFLNAHQEKQMAFQPDMIVQFAHFLRDHYAARGVQEPTVRAEVYVTLNGRPSRLYFDPQLDLTRIEESWKPRSWLLYTEPTDQLSATPSLQ
jgi:hypothetical protein